MSKSLDKFKLYYEDLEICKVSKNKVVIKNKQPAKAQKSAVDVRKIAKARVSKLNGVVNAGLLNAKNKLVKQPKRAKKLTKAQRLERKEQKKRGILGIGLLFVVVSIAYSTFITRTFVDSDASLVALAPQVVFASITFVKAFSKIYR